MSKYKYSVVITVLLKFSKIREKYVSVSKKTFRLLQFIFVFPKTYKRERLKIYLLNCLYSGHTKVQSVFNLNCNTGFIIKRCYVTCIYIILTSSSAKPILYSEIRYRGFDLFYFYLFIFCKASV